MPIWQRKTDYAGIGVADAKILVIKHGALGDLVQGFDAYAGLRAGHPDAYIALLTSPPFSGIATLMPWFDEVITDPRASPLNLVQTGRIRSILRAGWDMVIDLQCSRRTARYHHFLAVSDCRWFGTAAGASDPYPDFAGVNNADRMKTGIAMAGVIPRSGQTLIGWQMRTRCRQGMKVPLSWFPDVPGQSRRNDGRLPGSARWRGGRSPPDTRW